ncbi:hypothetical protein H0H92_006753, partial [Tricholoma furcatifolium]
MSKPYPAHRPDSAKKQSQKELVHANIVDTHVTVQQAVATPEQAPPYTAKPTEGPANKQPRINKRLPEASPEKPGNRASAKKLALSNSPSQPDMEGMVDNSPLSSPSSRFSENMIGDLSSPTPAVRDRPPHLQLPAPIYDNMNQPQTQATRATLATQTRDEDVDMTNDGGATQNQAARTQNHTDNTPPAPNHTPPPPNLAQQNGTPQGAVNLPPNITMPEYTPTSPMGFPTVHLGTLPSYWIDSRVLKDFDNRPEPKLWARLWMGVHDESQQATDINTIRRHIYFKTGEKALVVPPTAKDEKLRISGRMKRFHPPYHYLVTGLSHEAARKCIDLKALGTRDTQIFFLPYDVDTPLFIATIGGFTFALDDLFPEEFDDADRIVTNAVRTTICSDLAFINIIASRSTTPTTAENFARNIYAVSHTEEVPKSRGEPRSAPPRRATRWNLFFRNPPSHQNDGFFIFAKQVRRTTFLTLDRGRGRALDGAQRYHCILCKGADHNQIKCPYLSIPGWFGTASESQQEDGSLEFVAGDKGDRDDDKGQKDSRNTFYNPRGGK